MTLLFFSACVTPSKVIDTEADKAIILKNIAAFSQHVMNGDAKAIAAAYTDNGKIFPNDRDIMEGTDALIKYWTPHPKYQTTHHKITPSEIKILGNEAYDYGYYEGKTLNKESGEASSWRGKYVIVWKKIINADVLDTQTTTKK